MLCACTSSEEKAMLTRVVKKNAVLVRASRKHRDNYLKSARCVPRGCLTRKRNIATIAMVTLVGEVKMKRNLYPKEYKQSAYEIDYEAFYKKGYRGILFDIDNTLVPHGAPADERAKKLFSHLKELGYHVMLLSNNKEPRVKSFNDEVGAQYIYKAGKPKKDGYVRAMKELGTDTKNTLFVGDQIFTDIWGANRAGIYTVLVKKIHPKEEIQIVLKRALEFFVLLGYKHYQRKQHSS